MPININTIMSANTNKNMYLNNHFYFSESTAMRLAWASRQQDIDDNSAVADIETLLQRARVYGYVSVFSKLVVMSMLVMMV